MSRYPFFYAYLGYTMLRSTAFAFPQLTAHPGYPQVFWWTYVVAGLMRFGLAAEIYRHTFPAGSPVRRRAGIAMLSASAPLPIIFWFNLPGSSAAPDMLRKIAFTVALLILSTLAVARYYGIGLGRNVWGIAAGLLLFTGSELAYLAGMDLIPSLWRVWRDVHPLAFDVMLIVWTIGLWRYAPNPQPSSFTPSLMQEAVRVWEHQWAQVSNIVRQLVKP